MLELEHKVRIIIQRRNVNPKKRKKENFSPNPEDPRARTHKLYSRKNNGGKKILKTHKGNLNIKHREEKRKEKKKIAGQA